MWMYALQSVVWVKRCRSFLWPSTDYVLARLCAVWRENGLCVMLYCVKSCRERDFNIFQQPIRKCMLYEYVFVCMCALTKKNVQGVAMPPAYTPNTESASDDFVSPWMTLVHNSCIARIVLFHPSQLIVISPTRFISLTNQR